MAYSTYSDILNYLGGMISRPGRPGSPGPSMGFGYGAMSTPLPGPRPTAPTAPPAAQPPRVARPQGPLPGLGGPGYVPGQGPAIPDYGAMFGGSSTSPTPPPPATPGPSTKITPGGTLSFAWGGGAPQDYQPGITDVLKMEGAPAARGGFMGVEPVARGMEAGGFGPSETDWSKVANPLAFEGYREKPIISEIERAAKDPLWREREIAGIEQGKEVAIAKERATAEASLVEEANRRQREDVNKMAQSWIEQENTKRRTQGQPPLSLQEEQQFYMLAQSRVTGRSAF